MISAIVATYGDKSVWGPLGERAVGSLDTQTAKPEEIIRVHGDTLAQARNQGALWATGAYLLFVDADDCVDQNYIKEMTTAIMRSPAKRLLLQPSNCDMYEGGSGVPSLLPPRRLIDQNFLIIGTVVQRELFLDVGGFHEYGALEDWDLWIRCVLADCTIRQVPDAIYLVLGFDRNGDQTAGVRARNQIRAEHMEAWLAHEQKCLGVTPRLHTGG